MGFRVPPFRFEDFLKAFDGYRVFEADLPPQTDVRLICGAEEPHRLVYLRRGNSRSKLRFALAHAVIHSELQCVDREKSYQLECRTSEHAEDGRRNILEREADFGAAALLMPLWMVDRFVPKPLAVPRSEQLADELARTFRVSPMAMRVQLNHHAAATRRLPPAAAEPGARRSAPATRSSAAGARARWEHPATLHSRRT